MVRPTKPRREPAVLSLNAADHYKVLTGVISHSSYKSRTITAIAVSLMAILLLTISTTIVVVTVYIESLNPKP